jgi:hypothetical protein
MGRVGHRQWIVSARAVDPRIHFGRGIAARPQALVPLTPELAARMTAATEGVDSDPDAPIEGDAAL